VTTSIRKTSNAVVERAVRMVEDADLVALDLETTGLDAHSADIRLLQVSDSEKTFVIDLFKRDATDLVRALAREDLTVLAHGGDFEWRFVYHHFGVSLENIADTMLMTLIALAGDRTGFGLGDIVRDELGLELDKEMQTSDWSAEKLSRRQLDYAAMDVKVLPPLYEILREVLEDTEQGRVAAIENGALPAFALMQYVGMPVDKGAWDERAEETERVLRRFEQHMLDAPWMPPRPPVPQEWKLQGPDCLAMLRAAGLGGVSGTTAKDLAPYAAEPIVATLLAYRKAKVEERDELKASVLERAPEKPPVPAPPWNFGSSRQVAEIAREILGVELENTEMGTLLRYKGEHPFFEHVLTHRKLKKLVSTYGKGWFQQAYSGGRVYPAWRQMGTTTGRVASGERGVAPNAQNVPASHRKFFVVPTGRVFACADYSQIEVRILAKMLGEERLLKIYGRPGDEAKSGDVYRTTAAYMLGVELAAVTKNQRNLAKAIVLGMNYGLGAYGLPQYAFEKLGIKDMSVEEAEEYVEAFYDLYPKIRGYHETTVEILNSLGSVDQRTLAGRLRSDITSRNEAINAPVQGTSADILKRAMALAYRRLKAFEDAFIVTSIHDELLVECEEGDAEAVAEVIEGAMLQAADEILNADEPKVKIEVDATVGKRWTKG
jgi:DNA polymerase I-like protein with 3'-5' exonuclease and polymerase domains